MKIESEGGAAFWVEGTLMVPSVQGHGLPQAQELWPYQSLFLASGSWWSEGLFDSSFSVAQHIRHIKGPPPPLLGSYSGVKPQMFLLCSKQLPWCGDRTPASFPQPNKDRSSPTNSPLYPPYFLHLMEFCVVLYIIFQWSGTSACSQLVLCKHFCVWRYREMYSTTTYSSAVLFSELKFFILQKQQSYSCFLFLFVSVFTCYVRGFLKCVVNLFVCLYLKVVKIK